MGDRVSDGFDELVRFKKSLELEFRVSDFEPGAALVINGIKEWIDTDKIQILKDSLWYMQPPKQKLELKKLSSPSPAFKLFKEHPLLCGLMLFDFQIALQEAGLHDANQSISILSCAHLYNAVQKTNLLSRQWEDLEHILSSHRAGEFFLRSQPDTLSAFVRQWVAVDGVSATVFSRDVQRRVARHRGSISAELLAAQTNKRRALETPTPLSSAFSANYQLQLLESSVTKGLGPTRPNVSSAVERYIQRRFPKKDGTTRELSWIKSKLAILPVEYKVEMFLDVFREYESQALAFNYARMHQRCFQYLRSLLPLSPEVEKATRENPRFDTNAVLVNSLFHMEREVMIKVGIPSDTAAANIPGTTFQVLSLKMNYNRKGG